MAALGVQLIPSPEEIMQILKRTGAFREGHFVYPNGKHTAHYFQMPLAFRYYDTARVLAVALSRKFRVERDIGVRQRYRLDVQPLLLVHLGEQFGRATDALGRTEQQKTARVERVMEYGNDASLQFRAEVYQQVLATDEVNL